jgi:hypothetical protein
VHACPIARSLKTRAGAANTDASRWGTSSDQLSDGTNRLCGVMLASRVSRPKLVAAYGGGGSVPCKPQTLMCEPGNYAQITHKRAPHVAHFWACTWPAVYQPSSTTDCIRNGAHVCEHAPLAQAYRGVQGISFRLCSAQCREQRPAGAFSEGFQAVIQKLASRGNFDTSMRQSAYPRTTDIKVRKVFLR